MSKKRKQLIITGVISIATIAFLVSVSVISMARENNYKEYLEKGSTYIIEENYREAIVTYKKLIEINPKDVDGRVGLGEAYIKNKQYVEALETYREGISIQVGNSKKVFEEKLDYLLSKIEVNNIEVKLEQGEIYKLPINVEVKIGEDIFTVPIQWNNGEEEIIGEKDRVINGYSNTISKAVAINIIVKTDVIFDGLVMDISGLIEINRKAIDINNDGNEEEIVLYGEKVYGINYGKCIVIYHKGGTVLTSFNCPLMTTGIGDITDVTGDNVKDILVNWDSGGSVGGNGILLVYKNGTYVIAEEDDIQIEYGFIENFKYEAKDLISGKTFKADLSESQKERYIKAGILDENGGRTNIPLYDGSVGAGSYLRDIDGDGTGELLYSWNINTLNSSDTTVTIVAIYKYEDNKLVLKDLYGETDKQLNEMNKE